MLSEKNIEFLKDLQHELNTQENDGNAEPIFWGIMEKMTIPAYEGCGDGFFAYYEGEHYKEDEIDLLKESLEDFLYDNEDYQDVNIHDLNTLKEIADEIIEVELYDYSNVNLLSQMTGAFITKSAAKKYIENCGYNHKQPHTYAMTAYRNFELEELLKIIKETNWEALKCLIQTEKN